MPLAASYSGTQCLAPQGQNSLGRAPCLCCFCRVSQAGSCRLPLAAKAYTSFVKGKDINNFLRITHHIPSSASHSFTRVCAEESCDEVKCRLSPKRAEEYSPHSPLYAPFPLLEPLVEKVYTVFPSNE